MVSFRDFVYPPITLAAFQALRKKDSKRICFGSVHKTALKNNPTGKSAGFFNVPFIETIGDLFPLRLFENTRGQYGGYYRTVTDDSEFSTIHSWMSENSDVVFIRSLFNTAVAACEHYITSDQRSQIGELERSAKFDGNATSKSELVRVLTDIYRRMHGTRNIDGFVSVPATVTGDCSLPNYLAIQLSTIIGIPDYTGQLSWSGPKPSIKELSVDEKWNALERVGLTVGPAVSSKNLLLIDDMYQSGATAHFVASRLRVAGANELHLLAVSKGRRDTDNL
jgi:predicted amidophosphoribosyltransferase